MSGRAKRVLLSLLIKTFLVQVFAIPSGFLTGTLRKGDRVTVDKCSPRIQAFVRSTTHRAVPSPES
ncbi:S26 family signal peptidase [Kitasatospora phosalacinea]|uniref:S26 family signal peptidase n=1 Tax=Kitasatospora phosalacinea TaxID=2065 RepID=UPI000527F78A